MKFILVLFVITVCQAAARKSNVYCERPIDCRGRTPYCLDGKCVANNDKVCIAEGRLYTGGVSCCYPMVNPKKKGLPCCMQDTFGCTRDIVCSTRANNNDSVCCSNFREGKGECHSKRFLPRGCQRAG